MSLAYKSLKYPLFNTDYIAHYNLFWNGGANKLNCLVNKIIYLLQLHNNTKHLNTIHTKYYPTVKNYINPLLKMLANFKTKL